MALHRHDRQTPLTRLFQQSSGRWPLPAAGPTVRVSQVRRSGYRLHAGCTGAVLCVTSARWTRAHYRMLQPRAVAARWCSTNWSGRFWFLVNVIIIKSSSHTWFLSNQPICLSYTVGFLVRPVLVVALVERWTRDWKVAGSTPGRGAIKSTRSTRPSISPG